MHIACFVSLLGKLHTRTVKQLIWFLPETAHVILEYVEKAEQGNSELPMRGVILPTNFVISRIPWFKIGGGIIDIVAFQIIDIGEAQDDIRKTQDSEWNTKSSAKESIITNKKKYVFIYIYMEYSCYLLLLLLLLLQFYFLTRPV